MNNYVQKADEHFNNLLNKTVREKGNVAKTTLEFIKRNLDKDEYFDFCQEAGMAWKPQYEDNFEVKNKYYD